MSNGLVIHIPEHSDDESYFCTGCGTLFTMPENTAHDCPHYENSSLHKEIGISRTTGASLKDTNITTPKDLAEEAIRLVYGDRNADYGHPYDDYTRTAALWSALISHEITAPQAALMMVLVKLSREINKPANDNIVDAHGYLLVYGRILERMNDDRT